MFFSEQDIIRLIHKHAKNSIINVVGTDPNAIPKSIGLARGDLITFTGESSPVRLPMENGKFLVGDSNSANGWSYKQLTNTVPITLNNYNIGLEFDSNNLKVESNKLTTIQNIHTTATPSFNQINLVSDGNSNQAVRGGRQISTSVPLTGGGDLTANRTIGLSFNPTNLRITSNALNTIQDIAESSSPLFEGITIRGKIYATTLDIGVGNNQTYVNVFQIFSNRTSPTNSPMLIGDGNYLQLGNPLSGRSIQYSGIHFRNIDYSSMSIVYDFYNQTFLIGRSNNSGTLLPLDNGYEILRIDLQNKRVGVNQSSPSYTLDINGVIRGTDNILSFGVIKQYSSTGVNEYYANVEQIGSKSIYNAFTSGWTGSGWRVDYGITNASRSHLELDDLTVRGTMRVYELIINQIRATNGSLFVSSAAKVESYQITSGDPEYIQITFEDPEGHNVCPFLVNDIILMQRVRLDSTTLVKRIVGIVVNVNNRTVNLQVISRTGNIEKGDLFVRIGNTSNTNRQGSLYLTSDDSNAPYMDVIDGVNSWNEWTSKNKLKLRLGRLSGITSSSFGQLLGYGLYSKGNAYFEDESLTNSLSLRTDSDSGMLLKINYAGANPFYLSFGKIFTNSGYLNLFGLSLRDNTGKNYFTLSNTERSIAGWQFDEKKLFKNNDIILDSFNKEISINNGKVRMFYLSNLLWGLEGKDVFNNVIFRLGAENHIAGWNFDQYRLSNNDVYLETSPMKGLRVYEDTIKIGIFDDSELSISPVNITFDLFNGYQGITPDDPFWGILGGYWNSKHQYSQPDLILYNGFWIARINNQASSWDYVVGHRLFSHDTLVITKDVILKGEWKFTLGMEGLAYSGGKGYIAFRYYDESFNTLYRWIAYEIDIPDDLSENMVIDFYNGLHFNLPDIPCSYVYIEFGFYGGGQTGTYIPYDMEFYNLQFEGYQNIKVWINQNGVKIYNSPNNNLSIHKDKIDFNLGKLSIRGKKPARVSKHTSLPIENIEIGDIVIVNDEAYICVGLNSLGLPNYKKIS